MSWLDQVYQPQVASSGLDPVYREVIPCLLTPFCFNALIECQL